MNRKIFATTRGQRWWVVPCRAVKSYVMSVPQPVFAPLDYRTPIHSKKMARRCRTLAANPSARGLKRRACAASAPGRHNPATAQAANWHGFPPPLVAWPDGRRLWLSRHGSGICVGKAMNVLYYAPHSQGGKEKADPEAGSAFRSAGRTKLLDELFQFFVRQH